MRKTSLRWTSRLQRRAKCELPVCPKWGKLAEADLGFGVLFLRRDQSAIHAALEQLRRSSRGCQALADFTKLINIGGYGLDDVNLGALAAICRAEGYRRHLCRRPLGPLRYYKGIRLYLRRVGGVHVP